ncbi:MAG: c-type cytochrome [Nevskiales bacterium]
MKKIVSLLALLTLALCQQAFAESLIGGDAEAGKAKAAACTACHGPGGNSTNPEWPRLAGQSEAYTVGQLKAFKDGSRANPLMAGQVMNLSEQDMKDIAAYFFNQDALAGAASPDLAEAGATVYRAGNKESGVPACMGCHGPAGDGNAAAAYPRLAGQHADYVAAQLRIYRDGKRKGTAKSKMMSDVAAKLTDEEITAVASYLSGLH